MAAHQLLSDAIQVQLLMNSKTDVLDADIFPGSTVDAFVRFR